MPLTKTVAPITGDVTSGQDIDGLLSGSAWASLNLTYSFPDSKSDYGKGYGSGEPNAGFRALNTVQQQAVTTILNSYASVSDLSFTLIPFHAGNDYTATLRYAESNKPSTAWAYYPSESPEGGDVWFNNASHRYDNPVIGNYAWATILHETGHALGLKHAHETNVYGAVPASHDSLEYSVMSYYSYVGDTANGYTNATWAFPQTLMQDDIAAIQYLYGADFGYHSGDTRYLWSPSNGSLTIFENGSSTPADGGLAPGGNVVFETIWDGVGNDTYDFHLYATSLQVDLRPGQWTQTDTAGNFQTADLGAYDNVPGPHYAAGNVANSRLYSATYDAAGNPTNPNLSSLIENAIGGASSDVFIANQAVNRFTGNASNDIFRWASLADLANTAFRTGAVETAADTIVDFAADETIDLRAVHPSALWSGAVDTEHYVYGDMDGDAAPDFAIHVQGAFDVVANWDSHGQWLLA